MFRYASNVNNRFAMSRFAMDMMMCVYCGSSPGAIGG
jgi:hypothetical protein